MQLKVAFLVLSALSACSALQSEGQTHGAQKLVPSHAVAQSLVREQKQAAAVLAKATSASTAVSTRNLRSPVVATAGKDVHEHEHEHETAADSTFRKLQRAVDDIEDNAPTAEEIEDARRNPFSWMKLHLEYLPWLIAAPLTAYTCALVWFFCCQAQRPAPVAEEDRVTGEFHDGVCDCHKSWSIFACACCCGCVRWPQTIDSAQLGLPFWIGALIFVLLQTNVVFSFGLSYCLLVAMLVYYRYKIRESYRMKTKLFDDECLLIKDTCVYTCCMSCAMAQEARHVEYCEHAVCPIEAMARDATPTTPAA